MGSICHSSSFVWNEQVWARISCSHSLSSLTVHCSYRLKFFVVRDHLWDGNSLPQLQSSWLVSTRGSRRSKYTEGVARRIATRNAEIESRVRGGPALFITKLMMTYAAFTRYFTRPLFYCSSGLSTRLFFFIVRAAWVRGYLVQNIFNV